MTFDEQFLAAFSNTMTWEGWDKVDSTLPGVTSKYGITLTTLQRWNPTLTLAQLDEELAKEIYFNWYWHDPRFAEVTDGKVARKLFDVGVNVGPQSCIRLLRSSLGAEWVGTAPITDALLDKVNSLPPSVLLPPFKEKLTQYYTALAAKNPAKFQKYLKGWLRRAQA